MSARPGRIRSRFHSASANATRKPQARHGIEIPVDRAIPVWPGRAIGIVRCVRPAAEQIELVSKHPRRRVDGGVDEIGMAQAKALNRRIIEIDIETAADRSGWPPSRSRLTPASASSSGPSARRRHDALDRRRHGPQPPEQTTGTSEHQRFGFRALIIRFHPASRSTTGRSRRNRRGTSSGEIWRCTI